MGFLEKLKNTFFEEEYVEIEEKPRVQKEIRREPKREIKKEVIKVEERPKVVVKREEPKEEVIKENDVEIKNDSFEDEVKVIEPVSTKKIQQFDYFDEDDFLDFKEEKYVAPRPVEPAPKKEEVVKQPKLYDNPTYASKTSTPPVKSSGPYSKQMKTGFQPTPIISPIYGILDKNYTKEEISEKKDTKPSSYVSRKNADLDSVREKAFGSLMGDFDITSSSQNSESVVSDLTVEVEEEFEMDDNLLYDMTNDCKTPTVDKVTLQDAEEYFQDLGLEYNIDYKDAKLEKATGRRVSKTPRIDEIEEEEIQEEFVPKKTSSRVNRVEESSSLEDNLFDLIDSMYEEKE